MSSSISSRIHKLPLTAVLFVLPATALVACSSDNEASTSAAATTATSSTGAGGETASSSTSGSGGEGGEGGMLQNPDSCDPIAQDCVEAEASKCAVDLSDKEKTKFSCEAPLGDQMLGEDCVRPNGVAGEDTCAAGLYCAYYSQPKSDPQTRTCHALCTEASPCADPARTCVSLDLPDSIGACAEACSPTGNNLCPDQTKCTPFNAPGEETGTFACSFAGSTPAYEACASFDECEVGTVCNDGLCRPYCDDLHSCGDASIGCIVFPENGIQHAGRCYPSDYTCLGSVVWPSPVNPSEVVNVYAVLQDMSPVEGLVIKACALNDALCAAPLDQQLTDTNGYAGLTVPMGATGFDGYFEASGGGFATQLSYQNAPITGVQDVLIPALQISDLSAGVVGSPTADASRGALLLSALDCAYGFAAGLTVDIDTADASTVNAPSLMAGILPGTIPNSFDPAAPYSVNGTLIALNVPAGTANVTVNVPGGTLANLKLGFRPGGVTVVGVYGGP